MLTDPKCLITFNHDKTSPFFLLFSFRAWGDSLLTPPSAENLIRAFDRNSIIIVTIGQSRIPYLFAACRRCFTTVELALVAAYDAHAVSIESNDIWRWSAKRRVIWSRLAFSSHHVNFIFRYYIAFLSLFHNSNGITKTYHLSQKVTSCTISSRSHAKCCSDRKWRAHIWSQTIFLYVDWSRWNMPPYRRKWNKVRDWWKPRHWYYDSRNRETAWRYTYDS